MDVQKGIDTPYEKGDAERFTGDVRLRHGPSAAEMGGTGVAVVSFQPGARTFWHSHPGGQFLYVLHGKGRVRSEGEAGTEPVAGDILYVPPGEVHFHGGSPEAPMVHLAINGGGAPSWGAEVTDEEYGEGF